MKNETDSGEQLNNHLIEFEKWCAVTGETSVDKFVESNQLGEREALELKRISSLENRVNDFFMSPQRRRVKPHGADDVLGKQIGPYKLARLLGEGGMGTVWLAEQLEPVRRDVAVKLIRSGFELEDDQKHIYLARFDAERQSLASMSHPHIAKILDAGTTDGCRPYFVMEYVSGTCITLYCNQNKLSLHERLGIFLQLCEAIQHAHQKSVLHRDIKPTNALVSEIDGKPQVKVIDFGLARNFADEKPNPRLTQFQTALGSPLWMSPEQAGGRQPDDIGDVDTRSDIYSLGVVLYQLLTNTTPITEEFYHSVNASEFLDAIREQIPPYPSVRIAQKDVGKTWVKEETISSFASWSNMLSNDLDWVTMKAIDAQPDRRYQNVAAFADDIRRFMNCEPVIARPPSGIYRLKKLVHKHKRAAIATGCGLVFVAASAIGMAGVTGWALSEREKASTQTLIAEKERDNVEEIVSAFINCIGDKSVANANVQFSEEDSKFLLRVHEQLGGVEISNQKLELEFQMALNDALVHEGLNDVLFDQTAKLIRSCKKVYGADSDEVVGLLLKLAFNRSNWAKRDETAKLIEECSQILERRKLDSSHPFLTGVASARASALIKEGRSAEVPALLKPLLKNQHQESNYLHYENSAHEKLSDAYVLLNDFGNATKYSKKALDGIKLLGQSHPDVGFVESKNDRNRAKINKLDKSPDEIAEFVENYVRKFGEGQRTIAVRNNCIETLMQLRAIKLARVHAERQIDVLKTRKGYPVFRIRALEWLCQCYERMGEIDRTLETLELAIAAREKRYGPKNVEVATNCLHKARLLFGKELIVEAQKSYLKADKMMAEIPFDVLPEKNQYRRYCKKIEKLVFSKPVPIAD